MYAKGEDIKRNLQHKRFKLEKKMVLGADG